MIRGGDLSQELIAAADAWVGTEDSFDDAAREHVQDAARECVRHLPEHHRCSAVWEEIAIAFYMGMAIMRELARRGLDHG